MLCSQATSQLRGINTNELVFTGIDTYMERRTLENAGIGALVGLVLTFVPLISLLAPLVGGGVAGYRERRGAKGGLLPGALAGAFVAAGGVVIRTAFATLRFGIEGAIPVAGVPLPTLLAALFVGTFLTVVAAAGTVLVAAIGGALGGVLEEDRSRRRTDEAIADPIPGAVPRTRRLVTALLSLVAGLVTFVAVGLGLTEVLDPYIWPSALVGLPVGAILGVAVAVLGYHVLTTRGGRRRDDDESSGAI